jgi:hypothetical protein
MNSRKFVCSIVHRACPIPLESPPPDTPHSPAPVPLVTPMDRYARLWMLSYHKLMFAPRRECPPTRYLQHWYLQHWGRSNLGLGFLVYAYTNPRISQQHSWRPLATVVCNFLYCPFMFRVLVSIPLLSSSRYGRLAIRDIGPRVLFLERRSLADAPKCGAAEAPLGSVNEYHPVATGALRSPYVASPLKLCRGVV